MCYVLMDNLLIIDSRIIDLVKLMLEMNKIKNVRILFYIRFSYA